MWHSAHQHCEQDPAFSTTASWMQNTPRIHNPFWIALSEVYRRYTNSLSACQVMWEMYFMAFSEDMHVKANSSTCAFQVNCPSKAKPKIRFRAYTTTEHRLWLVSGPNVFFAFDRSGHRSLFYWEIKAYAVGIFNKRVYSALHFTFFNYWTLFNHY